MTDSLVRVEIHGGRADVILNRPERKNSLTAELTEQLRDAIVRVTTDDAVRCVLLRGEGSVFCSGIDLKMAGDGTRPGPMPAWPEVHAALYTSPIPVVAALEKYAINAGASLVLASHITVAGESSFLQIGELAIGVAAPMCAAWLHLRHSPAVADRLVYLADRVPAPELLRLGIVAEVVSDAMVVHRAEELANRISEYPAHGVRAMNATWKKLRGEISHPTQWFSDVLAR